MVHGVTCPAGDAAITKMSCWNRSTIRPCITSMQCPFHFGDRNGVPSCALDNSKGPAKPRCNLPMVLAVFTQSIWKTTWLEPDLKMTFMSEIGVGPSVTTKRTEILLK